MGMKLGPYILLLDEGKTIQYIWYNGGLYALRSELYRLSQSRIHNMMRYSDPDNFIACYAIRCGIVREVKPDAIERG